MKRSEVILFLTTIAEAQLRYAGFDMARYFRFPIAYYLPERVLVFSRPDMLKSRYLAHETYLKSVGVHRIRPQNVTILDATEDRAMIALEWQYANADGHVLRQSQVRYVLCRNEVAGDLQIELVDYSVTAYPEYMEQPS